MCSVDGISVPFPDRNKATSCYLRKYFIHPELESLLQLFYGDMVLTRLTESYFGTYCC